MKCNTAPLGSVSSNKLLEICIDSDSNIKADKKFADAIVTVTALDRAIRFSNRHANVASAFDERGLLILQ